MENWNGCKNVLCIRPDNMGDLLMSGPAIRAVKESFGCTLTLLTSSMAAGLAAFLPGVDEVMTFNAPWVKCDAPNNNKAFYETVDELRSRHFDAAVLFTVFSQNPLPTAMVAYLAGIPKRLAYCRENPYGLLTHWIPDKEPYSFVRHQVERDLQLVKSIGAVTKDKRLRLHLPNDSWPKVKEKLTSAGVNVHRPHVILHAGVSEPKREYPAALWIEAARQISAETDYQILLTGNEKERPAMEKIKTAVGENAFNLAGCFPLQEFIALVQHAPLVVSVNTATVHIAAAVNTPVIVLYALTNPQHLPWMAKGKALFYDVPEETRSRNEVLRYVHKRYHPKDAGMTDPSAIVRAVKNILLSGGAAPLPLLVPLRLTEQFV